MFTMTKQYGGETLALPTLYVDEVGTWYQWEEVRIHADRGWAANQAAMVFDGINDFVNCGADLSLNLTGAMSLSCWVWLDDVSAARYLVRRLKYGIYVLSNEMVYFETRNAADTGWDPSCGTTAPISQATWTHLVAVYDPAAQEKVLYVNGDKQTPVAKTDGGIASGGSQTFYIGGYSSTTLPGRLRDIQVYDRAVSQAEITVLTQHGQVMDGLIGYWLGTGNTANEWQDLSGNTNHGTVNGSPSLIASLEQESLVLNEAFEATVQIGQVQFAFPLPGSAFTSPKTGTLKLRVSDSLDPGIHRFPFFTELPRLNMAGRCLAGMGRYAACDRQRVPLPTAVQVQVLGTANPLTYAVPMVTS